MYICHCRAVNERTVCAAIDAGARSVAEIGAACGAGTDCASCHPELERLLSERALCVDSAGWRNG